jgi:hypothetical protein
VLNASKLKCTLILRPEELAAVPLRDGIPRVTLQVKLPDRMVTADIASKSLRKAQVLICEVGAENAVVILQGNLGVGDAILEAGLAAQVKMAKKEAAA